MSILIIRGCCRCKGDSGDTGGGGGGGDDGGVVVIRMFSTTGFSTNAFSKDACASLVTHTIRIAAKEQGKNGEIHN